jgi:hypothetical protein
MVGVDECHDFGGCDIYLIGSHCFAYEQGCDSFHEMLCGFCGGVVA